MTTNERWLQFAYINAKGNINKTALKIPFHTDLEIDQEIDITILKNIYTFSCVGVDTKTNYDDTVDITYVIATNNQ